MDIFAVCAAAFGLIVAFCLAAWILKADEGTDRMKEIAGYIREGAMAFLKREYKTMAIVIVALFLLIGIGLQSWTTAVLYVFGALLSVLAGFFGMKVATAGNVRTAQAAKESGMNKALKIAFCNGSLRIRFRTFGSRPCDGFPGSCYRNSVRYRFRIGSFFNGSVRKSRGRYLY